MRVILVLSTFVLPALPIQAAVMNYVITGYVTGSSPILEGTNTDVTGSGSTSQTLPVVVGSSFVDFTIGDANTISGDRFLPANINALPTVAVLRVTVAGMSANNPEMMIARTSNSQGLTDVGTLSILIAGADNNTINSASFRFNWRNAANTAPLSGNNQIIFTSYDIDFTQRNVISVSDYSTIGFATNTRLRSTITSGQNSIFDPLTGSPAAGSDSSVSEPRNAYAFATVAGDYEQIIAVDKMGGGSQGSGHSAFGNQLYMFSFRSPSPLIPTLNTVIPEPSSVLLSAIGLLAFMYRRR